MYLICRNAQSRIIHLVLNVGNSLHVQSEGASRTVWILMGAHHPDDRTIMGPGAPRKACDGARGQWGHRRGMGPGPGRMLTWQAAPPLHLSPAA